MVPTPENVKSTITHVKGVKPYFCTVIPPLLHVFFSTGAVSYGGCCVCPSAADALSATWSSWSPGAISAPAPPWQRQFAGYSARKCPGTSQSCARAPFLATPICAKVWFAPFDWQAIRKEFTPSISQSHVLPLSKSSKTGLGDAIHRVAAPIGQLIHWPCMKRDASGAVTQDLRPNSPCAKIRRGLNVVKV